MPYLQKIFIKIYCHRFFGTYTSCIISFKGRIYKNIFPVLYSIYSVDIHIQIKYTYSLNGKETKKKYCTNSHYVLFANIYIYVYKGDEKLVNNHFKMFMSCFSLLSPLLWDLIVHYNIVQHVHIYMYTQKLWDFAENFLIINLIERNGSF